MGVWGASPRKIWILDAVRHDFLACDAGKAQVNCVSFKPFSLFFFNFGGYVSALYPGIFRGYGILLFYPPGGKPG